MIKYYKIKRMGMEIGQVIWYHPFHLNNGRRLVKVVILGCGRVGATLATNLDREGHSVSVIDTSSDAFQRLSPDFRGETYVANGDDRNIMASQIAKEMFHVKKVICRIYDPIREQTYHDLGLETICPTIIGAQHIFDAITNKRQQ